jgi:hypothetical protein
MDMLKIPVVALMAATVLVVATSTSAEARHRGRDMHGWCRADAAQMMGLSRRAVVLERQVVRTAGGRYEIRGLAANGRFGNRPFTCQFNRHRVLQGAV